MTKNEFMEQLRTYVGDRDDDITLSLIESARAVLETDSEDWKAKYDDLDKSWRERYRNAFFETPVEETKIDVEEKPLTFESLFKEK